MVDDLRQETVSTLLEPRPGFEPGTYSLPWSCSATELSRHAGGRGDLCVGRDSNPRSPKALGLQPSAIDRSATHAYSIETAHLGTVALRAFFLPLFSEIFHVSAHHSSFYMLRSQLVADCAYVLRLLYLSDARQFAVLSQMYFPYIFFHYLIVGNRRKT